MPADPQLDYSPPRWRTPGRSIGVFGMLLILVLASRLYLGHAATRDLEAVEQEVRQRGEPWTIEDLRVPAVPPGETNGADLFRKAFALKAPDVDSPSNSIIDFDFRLGPRHDPKWREVARASAARHGTMYERAREAAAARNVDWGIRRSAASINSLFGPVPFLGNARDLANELSDHAVLQHLDGNTVGALASLNDSLGLARAVSTDASTVNHLVGLGIVALTADRLAEILLDVDAAKPDVATALLVWAERLEREETRMSESSARALAAEAVTGRATLTLLRGHAWLTRPVFDQTAARVHHDFRELNTTARNASATAVSQPTIGADPGHPFFMPGTTVPVLPPRPQQMLRHVFFGGVFDRYLEADRRIVMELRLLRVRLALRQFRAETGRWPASVDELVPAYLKAVPRSPHRPDIHRVEFTILRGGRPDGADRPMVYVDLQHGSNDPVEYPMTGWTASQSGDRNADADGRQWRDVEAWPLSAFPKKPPPGADSADAAPDADATTPPSTVPATQSSPEQPK